jgi:hypothetical protein
MSRWVPGLLVLSLCLAPMTCFAEDQGAPSIVSYGLEGFGVGLGVGLATGYVITTDKPWHSKNWKTLVLGAGIGALSGAGIGLIIGAIDAGVSPGGPGPGYYILQDMNYGVGLGFLVGGVVGALIWIGNGSGKDLLRGMAYGTLIGAGTGLVLGIIEGALRKPKHAASTESTVSFNLGFTTNPGSAPMPYPMLSGRF